MRSNIILIGIKRVRQMTFFLLDFPLKRSYYCFFADKFIRHRACALRDVANALIDDELDSDFETQCVEMKEFRRTRGKKFLLLLRLCQIYFFFFYFFLGVEGPVEPPPAFINLTKCDHLIVPDGSELDGNKRQNDTGSIDTHNNSMRRRRFLNRVFFFTRF